MHAASRRRKVWTVAACAAAACMALAVVLYGRTICFCSDDPDGCGEPCHVCGGAPMGELSMAEPCDHLSISDVDFYAEDTAVSVSAGHEACDCVAYVAADLLRPVILPAVRANAPPGERPDSTNFRRRRILLLS